MSNPPFTFELTLCKDVVVRGASDRCRVRLTYTLPSGQTLQFDMSHAQAELLGAAMERHDRPESAPIPLDPRVARRFGSLLRVLGAEPLTTIVDRERHWVSVSESFAHLLGYETEELVGHTVDEVTSHETIDVQFAFDTCFRIGAQQGIWSFDRRDGGQVFVSYYAQVRDNFSIARIAPLHLHA